MNSNSNLSLIFLNSIAIEWFLVAGEAEREVVSDVKECDPC